MKRKAIVGTDGEETQTERENDCRKGTRRIPDCGKPLAENPIKAKRAIGKPTAEKPAPKKEALHREEWSQ